jgi:O-antigen ligase
LRRDHASVARGLALATVVGLPLAVWPGLEHPFSAPKLLLLVTGVAACAALAWDTTRRPASHAPTCRVLGAILLLWLAPWAIASLFGEFVSFDALVLGVCGALWALVLARVVDDAGAVVTAQVLGTTGVALVTALQAIGVDPFRAAGWAPALAGASPRLAVYGTLGNPNFVAALMAGTAPLTAWLFGSAPANRPRWLAGAALACQVLALAATGSRGGTLGLVTGAVAWLLLPAGRRTFALALGGIALGGLLLAISPARPVAATLSGRLYVWRMTWPHAWDRPLAGHGPGAFEVLYPAWESAARQAGSTGGAPSQFAGPQQHAHNDYLEALVERGLPGAVSLAGVVCLVLVAGWRAQEHSAAAAGAAAVAALAAVASVDFPLARPAEVALFWTAVCVAVQGHSQEDA